MCFKTSLVGSFGIGVTTKKRKKFLKDFALGVDRVVADSDLKRIQFGIMMMMMMKVAGRLNDQPE